MLRSAAAVIGGFVVTAVLIMITDAVMQMLLPSLFPVPPAGQPYQVTMGGVVLNFTYAFLYAIVGGFVMAWIARRNIMKHLYWLLGLMVVFGVISAVMYAGVLPVWYEPLVVVLGVAGFYLGAWLYLRQRGEEHEGAGAEATPAAGDPASTAGDDA